MLAVHDVYKEALIMKPVEKVQLIEKLILSLDMPNKSIEQQWEKEAESRVQAYKEGILKTVSSQEVFAKYDL